MKLSRRSIIKGIPAFFMAILGRSATASLPPKTAASIKPMLLNRFSIAGFQFYKGPELIARLGAGMELLLHREPDNPHDEFAVEIYSGDAKLGYVPRSDNRHTSRLLAQSAKLDCRVAAVDSAAGRLNMVQVEVRLL